MKKVGEPSANVSGTFRVGWITVTYKGQNVQRIFRYSFFVFGSTSSVSYGQDSSFNSLLNSSFAFSGSSAKATLGIKETPVTEVEQNQELQPVCYCNKHWLRHATTNKICKNDLAFLLSGPWHHSAGAVWILTMYTHGQTPGR